MGTPTDKDQKPKSTNSPEQELGDTPVAPWKMPTPEEKKDAKPVRRALKEAIKSVDSQEKADEVMENLESSSAGKTASDVKQTQPPTESTATGAQKVQDTAQSATKSQKAEKVIEETARVLAASVGRQEEALAEAAQEALNPEQQGAPPTLTNTRQREYLRTAVLKRLKPLDALDANIFLAINHLPHTRWMNGFFYALTTMFNIVAPWYGEMGIAALRKRRRVKTILRESVFPLLLTTTLVELVIKSYFRRKRPFISIIQAIVIGKKPGTWSFPSGHAAAAFGGAWLLNHQSPRFSLLRYIVASLVGFSRIYLGDHYPGDVATGSLVGLLSAEFFHRLLNPSKRKRQIRKP